jgi:hypothetical protein
MSPKCPALAAGSALALTALLLAHCQAPVPTDVRDPSAQPTGVAEAPRRSDGSLAPAPRPATSQRPPDPLDPAGLVLLTTAETNARVRAVFPNGVATEDARAAIGTAPAPVNGDAPEPASEWVAEITPPTPLPVERLRAALPADGGALPRHWVKGRVVGSDQWLHHDAPVPTRFDRVAVVVDLFESEDRAVTLDQYESEAALARALARSLQAPEPTFSLTAAQAAAKATRALAARKQYPPEAIDVGVVIQAPRGKRFPGRLVWDAVYSAGFFWGDGDYFHWVPSPETDVSQGISMGTSTGPGYFFPEWLVAQDGSGDVGDLEMSFNLARVRQPTAQFDVMARAARYLGRRLGGTVLGKDGKAFDPASARQAVAAIEAALISFGVEPGSGLALLIF